MIRGIERLRLAETSRFWAGRRCPELLRPGQHSLDTRPWAPSSCLGRAIGTCWRNGQTAGPWRGRSRRCSPASALFGFPTWVWKRCNPGTSEGLLACQEHLAQSHTGWVAGDEVSFGGP